MDKMPSLNPKYVVTHALDGDYECHFANDNADLQTYLSGYLPAADVRAIIRLLKINYRIQFWLCLKSKMRPLHIFTIFEDAIYQYVDGFNQVITCTLDFYTGKNNPNGDVKAINLVDGEWNRVNLESLSLIGKTTPEFIKTAQETAAKLKELREFVRGLEE